jgi:hypothetical protein
LFMCQTGTANNMTPVKPSMSMRRVIELRGRCFCQAASAPAPSSDDMPMFRSRRYSRARG